jgi:hypothetical protein
MPEHDHLPQIIECDQCEEYCYEEIGYRKINGVLRAFIGCDKGGKIEIDMERVQSGKMSAREWHEYKKQLRQK